jgi:hypothetical protein
LEKIGLRARTDQPNTHHDDTCTDSSFEHCVWHFNFLRAAASRRNSLCARLRKIGRELALKGFLLAIRTGEFQVDSQITVEVGLAAVEIEVADGNACSVLGDFGVDRFGHDAARERRNQGALVAGLHVRAQIRLA